MNFENKKPLRLLKPSR